MTNSTNCTKCRKREACTDPDICPKVGPILRRIEHGDMRLKKYQHQIDIVYENEMTGPGLAKWNNCIYGAFDEE